MGTTELNQIQDRTYSDSGVPVGTKELDQRHDLFRYRTYQIQDLSDTGVPVGTTTLIQIQNLSDTGVPVGTTELNRIQEYP